VVPENIHTPPRKVTGNSKGGGGSKAEILRGVRGSWDVPFPASEKT